MRVRRTIDLCAPNCGRRASSATPAKPAPAPASRRATASACWSDAGRRRAPSSPLPRRERRERPAAPARAGSSETWSSPGYDSARLKIHHDATKITKGFLGAPASRRHAVQRYGSVTAGEQPPGNDLRLDLGSALEDVENAGVA